MNVMDAAKYSANQIARYFIMKGGNEGSERAGLTNLKLQKILYYAQGWYLVNFGKPLFKDTIEAWKYGPAIKSIYNEYSDYGSIPIPLDIKQSEVSDIDTKDQKFLDNVWNVYKKYSATDLMEATHNEMPWKETRKDIAAGDSSDAEISLSLIHEYFTSISTP